MRFGTALSEAGVGTIAREAAKASARRLGPSGSAAAKVASRSLGVGVAAARRAALVVPSALGPAGRRALESLGPANARRLAALADSGALARIGRTDELMAVVARRGDAGLEFVWKHEGALAVSAALAAFLADPDPFLDGARGLASSADTVSRPLVEAPGLVAVAAARRLGPALVLLIALAAILLRALPARHPPSIGRG